MLCVAVTGLCVLGQSGNELVPLVLLLLLLYTMPCQLCICWSTPLPLMHCLKTTMSRTTGNKAGQSTHVVFQDILKLFHNHSSQEQAYAECHQPACPAACDIKYALSPVSKVEDGEKVCELKSQCCELKSQCTLSRVGCCCAVFVAY